ncbi:MAG: hypothetical protein EOP53_04345 [Sphingobacteriales bacterium]|nr:MAG: hypothetical protein EOP53_04345 [Sphingobacteriales bacterium]
MKTAFFALFLSIGLTTATPHLTSIKIKQQTTVYVCDSKSAYAYHATSGCRYLNRCTHGVITLSKSNAESSGYSACKGCY